MNIVKITSKCSYDAVQLKRGNEHEVVKFVRDNLLGAWRKVTGATIAITCRSFSSELDYGDYIAVIGGDVRVIPKIMFDNYYKVVE